MSTNSSNLYAVIGDPISHSASPKMHSAMAEKLALNLSYITIHIPTNELQKGIEDLKSRGIKGFNVTVPHKESIMPFLDSIHPSAAQIGAVNTVINTANGLEGHNTDGTGFLASLTETEAFDLRSTHVCIIGTGGSAKAIATTLVSQPIASLTLINRTLENAKTLAASLQKQAPKLPIHALSPNNETCIKHLDQSQLVVQTTPLGMQGPNEKALPLPTLEWITPNHVCYDIIYTPSKTAFLTQAETAGARIINGKAMLAHQAAQAFQLFTGHAADPRLMYNAIG